MKTPTFTSTFNLTVNCTCGVSLWWSSCANLSILWSAHFLRRLELLIFAQNVNMAYVSYNPLLRVRNCSPFSGKFATGSLETNGKFVFKIFNRKFSQLRSSWKSLEQIIWIVLSFKVYIVIIKGWRESHRNRLFIRDCETKLREILEGGLVGSTEWRLFLIRTTSDLNLPDSTSL